MTIVGFSLFFGKIISVIFVILLAKLVLPEIYGEFRALLSIATLAALFADSGPSIYSTRMISSNWDNKKEVSRIVDTSFFIQVIFVLFSIIFLVMFNYLRIEIYILLISIIILDYVSAILRGQNRFVSTSIFQISNGIMKLFLLIIIGYALSVAMDTMVIVILYSGSILPALIILFCINRSLPRLPAFFSFNYIRTGIRFAIPAILITVAHYSTINLAIPFVNNYYGNIEASYIAVAFTFGSILSFIPSAINFVIMPIIARTKENNQIAKDLQYYLSITFLICGSVLAGLLLFPDFAIRTLFTPDFLPARIYFPSILPAFLFLALTTIFDAVWIGVGDLKIPLITSGTGALINVSCIAISILGNIGPMGIACAFSISRVSIFIMMLAITLKRRKSLISIKCSIERVGNE